MNRTYGDGRQDQYQEMMGELSKLEARYQGVRGALLAKVRAELGRLKPSAAALSIADAPNPAQAQASCRVCGREMRLNGTDGRLVCQNGHSR